MKIDMIQDLEAASKAYEAFLRALGVNEAAGIDVSDSARNTAQLMACYMHGKSE